jgi:hypothetical protein
VCLLDAIDERCDQRRKGSVLPGQADLDRRDIGYWDVGDAGVDDGSGGASWHEADRTAGGDVLELLFEVVDRRARPRLPAVGARVDVVEA